MAFVSGYQYDLFVSYAHADNVGIEPGKGWVSQFVSHLESALRQRLGGPDELEIFFDHRALGANNHLPELLEAAQESAVFLAVCSPSYVAHEWTLDELDVFWKRACDHTRLFMAECLPLDDPAAYPPPLRDHVRVELWSLNGQRRVPIPYSPTSQTGELQQVVHVLAEDIKNRLEELRLLPKGKPRRRVNGQLSAAADPASPGGRRRVVLLAQPTDDVADSNDQIRQFLHQYDETVRVLPDTCYPQGGEMFTAALAGDLAQADLFVQVLGKYPGRMPPDLPKGYTRHQLEAAGAAGVKIVQWRHPALDFEEVGDASYRELLSGESVVATGLEAFKRLVLDRLQEPEAPPSRPRPETVFINADRNDLSVAREIERECVKNALAAILPMAGPSSEANRRDLMDNLTDCEILLFIYGETEQSWIRSQLRLYSKIRSQRETDPKLLAICSGPPPEKPDIGISLPNAQVIHCPDAWDLESIGALLSERGV